MIQIATYQELRNFVRAFNEGHINLLVICSRGGLGKSEEVRSTIDISRTVQIGGHVTPLGLYELLYNGQDKMVVFDEIDGLLSNTQHVGLLKQLCETRTPKRVQWVSTSQKAQEIDGGVGHFNTSSHVLMLCNTFESLTANIAALETRASVIQFQPAAREIMDKIKTFAEDDVIASFLEQFHQAIPDFSLRTYRQLEGFKSAGLDWQRYALAETNIPPKVLEIADLLVRYDTDSERIEKYSGCRRNFYNWKPEAKAYLSRKVLAETKGATCGATPEEKATQDQFDGMHSCTMEEPSAAIPQNGDCRVSSNASDIRMVEKPSDKNVTGETQKTLKPYKTRKKKLEATRKRRRKVTAEFFTPDSLVDEILLELPTSLWEEGKTFLDPACGNGNLLIHILWRKIQQGHNTVGALRSIHGADIMRENIRECRLRLLKLVNRHEPVTAEHIRAVLQNIAWVGSKSKYPMGSLDYDFSFNHKVNERTVRKWLASIAEGMLDEVDLPEAIEADKSHEIKGIPRANAA